jgi:TRAP-type C4-dicarboxylate transport system permease small subunit
MRRKHRDLSLETLLVYFTTFMLVFLLTMQVFNRFILQRSVSWSEELSRISFVWMVFAAISYAAMLDKQIRVTFIVMIFPPKVQKILLTIADAICLVLYGVIVYQGILYVLRLAEFPYRSQTMGINLMWAYMIIPIGFTLTTIRTAQVMIKRFKKQDLEVRDSRLDM